MLEPGPAMHWAEGRETPPLYRLPAHCMASSWHRTEPTWIQCGFSEPAVSRLEFREGKHSMTWFHCGFNPQRDISAPFVESSTFSLLIISLTFQNLTSSTVKMVSHLSGKVGGVPPLPVKSSRNTLLFSNETNYSRQRWRRRAGARPQFPLWWTKQSITGPRDSA